MKKGRKVIAAINMTIDGRCDHTALEPGEDIHNHYTALLGEADAILYGRITFGLMEFWREIIASPTGKKSMDDFAAAIDKIPKIVFSNSLHSTDWRSARICTRSLEEEVIDLKQQPGNDILIGSRSLINQLLMLDLVDEYQLCIHPVIAGAGLPLFEGIDKRMVLQVNKTKMFRSGAIIFYYQCR